MSRDLDSSVFGGGAGDTGQPSVAPGDAPFEIGAEVVVRGRPERILIVREVKQLPAGHWIVNAGRSHRDYISVPAERLAAAPEGYCDPPSEPNGSAAYGLAQADFDAKREHDNNDRAYQAALARYHRAMMWWARDHAARVNPEAAKRMIHLHSTGLARAHARLAGRDPDAPTLRTEAA